MGNSVCSNQQIHAGMEEKRGLLLTKGNFWLTEDTTQDAVGEISWVTMMITCIRLHVTQ